MGTIRYADGSLGTLKQGGTHNNTKKYTNRRVGQYFVPHDNCKKNKANFGRTKKSNRENNKYKFGRVRLAKVLHGNISKAQMHTVVKKYPKKTKRANTNSSTSRFYNQKKRTQTRATKSTKNFTNSTDQIIFVKLRHAKSPEHKKK